MNISDKLIIQVSILRYKANVGFIPRFLFWLGFSSYFDKPIQDLIALEKSNSDISETTVRELLELYKNSSDFSSATQDILEHLHHLYPLQKANTVPEQQQQSVQKIKSMSELALSEHQSQQSFFSRWFGAADGETTFLTRLISCINALFSQDIKTRTTSDLTATIENQDPKLTTNPWIADINELITQLNTNPGTQAKSNEKPVTSPEQEVSSKPPVAPPAPKFKERQTTVPVKNNPTPVNKKKATEQHIKAPSYPAPQPPVGEKAQNTETAVQTKEENKPASVPAAPVYTAGQPYRKKEADPLTPPAYHAPEPPKEDKVQQTKSVTPPARPLPALPTVEPKRSEAPLVKKSEPAVPVSHIPAPPVDKKPAPSNAAKKPTQIPQSELIKEFKDICTKVTHYEKKTVDCLEKAKKLQDEVKATPGESSATEEHKKQGKGGRFFPKPKVISALADKAKNLKNKAQRKLLFKQKRYKSALNTVTKLQNTEFTLITQALLVFLKIDDKAFLKENSDNILALCRKARILGILIDISPEVKTELEQLIDACQGKLNVGQATVTAAEPKKQETKAQTTGSENIPNAPPAPEPYVHPKPSDQSQTKTEVKDSGASAKNSQQKAESEDKQALLLAIIQGTKLKPTIQNKPYSSSDDTLAMLEKSQLFQRQVSENDELDESSDLQSEEEWLDDSESDTPVELGTFMKPFAPIVETPISKTQEQPGKNNKPAPKTDVVEEPVNVEDLHKKLELIRLAYSHDFETEEEVSHVFSF
ncbi:hypothetical protein [Legionella shakespearei]|uniref:WH2 domain-containing protein n=1 Tax=Legionella shakespearei DSM 23087 TaxID=1122169 RepID=A0A0W0YM55_9GAMM|nr:hypothetical protein [Legionella shakespearei]KTD57667.1 hypothetical protein Lsha_2508 [Legionella shakespearei DSM 23087]